MISTSAAEGKQFGYRGARFGIQAVLGNGADDAMATLAPGVRIGRGTDNEITLPDDRVSRRHGQLTSRQGTLITSLNWHVAEDFRYRMKLLKNI